MIIERRESGSPLKSDELERLFVAAFHEEAFQAIPRLDSTDFVCRLHFENLVRECANDPLSDGVGGGCEGERCGYSNG